MNTEELRNWIDEYNIKERTVKGFWGYIRSYKAEEPQEFKDVYKDIELDLIDVEIKKVALIVNYSFDEFAEYIVSYLDINHNGEEIAEYEAVFTLDGEDMDDFLKRK